MTALTTDQLVRLRGVLGAKITQSVALTGLPTGGTFTLAYQSQTSAALPYNADSVAVEGALQALSTVGVGGALVTGASGGPWTVKIDEDDGSAIVAVGSLTGGTAPSVRVVVNVPFTDRRLNTLWTAAGEDFATTVVYALHNMLADDRLLTVYTIGVDGLNKQKVFDNTLKLLEIWEKKAGLDRGTISIGTVSLGIDDTLAFLRDTTRFLE